MAQIKIVNVLWKANSPYGTYVSGDVVDVYWDNVSLLFVVKKNNGTITSGNAIPFTFVYNQKPVSFYKQESITQVTICDSTDLVQFERVPAFPYLVDVRAGSHPSCSITGEVCDLSIDALPIVTGTTTNTSLDGQIVISASGSNGSVKYKLNADFRYNDGTGQVSGTFTGLSKGNYIVFIRDEKDCLVTFTVKVTVQKNYGVLYSLQYYDVFGVALHKTEILEKDYTGNEITVGGGNAAPTQYSGGMGGQDKFFPIFSSDMTFYLMSFTKNQYVGLYTNDPEKYRMRHSINGSVKWIGKVLPNQFEQEYTSLPYPVEVVAHDGLATLKEFLFLDDDNNRIVGQFKQITLISFILNKIGLGINIRSACNIFAEEMTSASADDPLDQAYVDTWRYYLKTETPTCWDVLSYILEPYGAQIVMWDNCWYIIRVEERVNSFNYREFDTTGDYVSNSTYNPVKDLKASGYGNRIVWTDNNATLKLNPGFGLIRLMYDLGLNENVFKNGDFSIKKYSVFQANVQPIVNDGVQVYNIPDLSGFTVVAGSTPIITGYESLEDGKVAVKFTTPNVGPYLLSETLSLKMGNSDEIKLKFSFKVRPSNKPYLGAVNTLAHYVKIKIKVTYGAYYLTDIGTWSTVDTNIVYYIKTEDINKYQKFEVTAESPLASYVDGANINVKFFFGHELDYDYANITALKAKLVAGLPSNYRAEVYDSVPTYYDIPTLIYYELRRTTSAESLPDIVRPTDYHATTNPYQWVLVSTLPLVDDNTYETYIDYVSLTFYNNGKLLPENANYEKSMENENDKILNRIIYHGSLPNTIQTYEQLIDWNNLLPGFVINPFLGIGGVYIPQIPVSNTNNAPINVSANAGDLVYTGWLRDSSGDAFTNWTRGSIPESKPIEEIYMDMFSAQYNSAWRTLSGSFIGDIIFSPIDCMRETMDSNRKYYAGSLGIDFKNNLYSVNFMELTDVSDNEGEEVGVGFSTGFSLGFNA